jgi:hypothetical protein
VPRNTTPVPDLPGELKQFVNDIVAARALGCRPQTLRKARSTKEGPYAKLRYYKFSGKNVQYDVRDLAAFQMAHLVELESAERNAPAPQAAPEPEEPRPGTWRTCKDCGDRWRHPHGTGRPPHRCPKCREDEP